MADPPQQLRRSVNMTSMSIEINDVTCPGNENYFSKANSSPSNHSQVFKMIFCHRNWKPMFVVDENRLKRIS